MFLGAFGDPGHAFPALALGRALAGRGHDVTLQTWTRWRSDVEREGMRFVPAPEYGVFPTRGRPLKPYAAAARAARETVGQIEAAAADAVVADILTLAPALAGELAGRPVATLIPHVDPRGAPGFPPYSLGARLPRTGVGRALWGSLDGLIGRALAQGRDELNATRARLGLPPVARVHNGISHALALVATFPQLEYPRPAPPPGVVVTGPLLWEPPFGEVVPPPGDEPLVLVAPSTVQDPGHRLLRAAVEGLADEPVRVLAALNRRPLDRPPTVPANARVVDWVSYARTMPRCDLVVTHGGHGTVARALASSCAVVCCPAGGDMGENAARVDWAGVGVRLPGRFVGPTSVRLAVRRALAARTVRERARALGAWAAAHDGATAAARAVEAWAAAPARSTSA